MPIDPIWPARGTSPWDTALHAQLDVVVDAVNALQAQTERTVVGSFIGDSYTGLNGGTETAPQLASRGFAIWAMAQAGCQFTFSNHGVGGETLPQMAARVDAMLAADRPAFVHLLGGLNDGFLEVPISESLTAIDYIVEAVRRTGAPLLVGTVSGRDAWDPAKEEFASIGAINRHIRAINRADVTVVDYNAYLVDPATGHILPELTYDGTHPNTLGAHAMSLPLVPVLERVAPYGKPLVNVEKAEGNLLDFGRFTDGAVGAALPTDWSYAVNGGQNGTTVSRVPRTDILGSWLQIEKTEENWSSTPASGWVTLADAGIAAGDLVEGSVEFQIEGLNPAPILNGNPGMVIRFADSGGSAAQDFNFFGVTSADAQVPDDREGVYRMSVRAPAGKPLARLMMPCYTAGMYRFDRAMLRKA